eukprot:4516157-Pyramimonas_sp.AAC.1
MRNRIAPRSFTSALLRASDATARIYACDRGEETPPRERGPEAGARLQRDPLHRFVRRQDAATTSRPHGEAQDVAPEQGYASGDEARSELAQGDLPPANGMHSESV